MIIWAADLYSCVLLCVFCCHLLETIWLCRLLRSDLKWTLEAQFGSHQRSVLFLMSLKVTSRICQSYLEMHLISHISTVFLSSVILMLLLFAKICEGRAEFCCVYIYCKHLQALFTLFSMKNKTFISHQGPVSQRA